MASLAIHEQKLIRLWRALTFLALLASTQVIQTGEITLNSTWFSQFKVLKATCLNWILCCCCRLINGKFKTPKKGKHNDNSHPPIHPVKYTPLSAIRDNDQRKLYELVTRHFLACCSEDAIGEKHFLIIESNILTSSTILGSETVIEFDISGEIFVAKGLIVEQLNYLQIYPYDRWVDKALPDFYQGEKIMPTGICMVCHRKLAKAAISYSFGDAWRRDNCSTSSNGSWAYSKDGWEWNRNWCYHSYAYTNNTGEAMRPWGRIWY